MQKPKITKSVGFAAIARPDARVFILGSLPGKVSLERRQYYAQPRNTFWRIMEEITGATPELSYDERILQLKENGVALWDVCAAGYRPGSLDSAIELSTVVANDFGKFFSTHPHISLICFNGSKSAEIYRRIVTPELPSKFQAIPHKILPSTSPAHAAMSFEQKLSRWRTALLACNRP